MENKSGIFKSGDFDRIESPEKLDKYLKTSKPSVWIVVISLLIVLIAVVVWGVVGKLPKVYNAEGVTRGGKSVYCYVPTAEASRAMVGCDVSLVLPDNSVVDGKVTDMSSMPYSASEMYQEIPKEWIVYNFFSKDGEYQMNMYMYKLEITTDEDIQEDYIVDVSIITESVKPIVYLLN